MAYGGTQHLELLCPVCKTVIDTKINDDWQATLDYHFLNVHPNLKNLTQPNSRVQDFKHTNENRHMYQQECTSCIICPLCESVVEIFQNNVNHCFMEHYEICHENELKLNEANNLSEQIFTEPPAETIEHIDKSKRNHSHLQDNKPNDLSSNLMVNLPRILKNHSGFVFTYNNHFQCGTCRETFNSQEIMEDHLKTKRHEDNIVKWLENKLPKHMHNTLEFVSFDRSNLCCNLCRCKIEIISSNPYETLLNIISHNTDVQHSKTKSEKDLRESNFGYTQIKSFIETKPLLNEHKEFIETEMEPRFKCKLCAEIIQFSKNDVELEKNFLTHIKSALHMKNSKAMSTLNLFRDNSGNNDGNHSFTVSNGVIHCTKCKCTITATIEQLLIHSKTNINLGISSLLENNKTDCQSTSSKPHLTTDNYSFPQEEKSPNKVVQKQLPYSQQSPAHKVRPNKTTNTRKTDVKELLHPLKQQFGNITCIAENDEGDVTCLICNCSIQPSTHCVKMHIMGKFHKIKTQSQIKALNSPDGKENQDVNQNNKGTSREPEQELIQHLFQSLPKRLQSEKDFCTINLTDGSINCTLCNCVIDPLFIKDHLQGELHIRQKQLKTA